MPMNEGTAFALSSGSARVVGRVEPRAVSAPVQGKCGAPTIQSTTHCESSVDRSGLLAYVAYAIIARAFVG